MQAGRQEHRERRRDRQKRAGRPEHRQTETGQTDTHVHRLREAF